MSNRVVLVLWQTPYDTVESVAKQLEAATIRESIACPEVSNVMLVSLGVPKCGTVSRPEVWDEGSSGLF